MSKSRTEHASAAADVAEVPVAAFGIRRSIARLLRRRRRASNHGSLRSLTRARIRHVEPIAVVRASTRRSGTHSTATAPTHAAAVVASPPEPLQKHEHAHWTWRELVSTIVQRLRGHEIAAAILTAPDELHTQTTGRASSSYR